MFPENSKIPDPHWVRFRPLCLTMKVNTLTTAEKEEFKKVAVPAVKKLIIEKFGDEGKDMLNSFLEAVKKTVYRKNRYWFVAVGGLFI